MSYRVKLSRLSCAVHPKIDRKQQNKSEQGQPAGTLSGDKAFFACARGGEKAFFACAMLLKIQTFGLYALLLKNPARHEFATKLALLGRM